MNAPLSHQEQRAVAALELVERARRHIQVYHPFYGALIMRLKMKVDPRHPSMYTDSIVIGFNPKFVTKLEWDWLVFIMVHEVQHCAMLHPFRRGDREPRRWNIAIDHVVNLSLLEDPELRKMRPPVGSSCGAGYADVRFKSMSAETVYSILDAEQQSSAQQDGETKQELEGAGGEAGDCCDAGASGEEPLFDPEPEEDEEGEGEEKQDPKDGGNSDAEPDNESEAEPSDDDEEEGEGGDSSEDDEDSDPQEGDGGEGKGGDQSGEDAQGKGEGASSADAQGEARQEGAGEAGEGEGCDAAAKDAGGSALDPAAEAQLEREWAEAVTTAVLAAGGEMGEAQRRALGEAGVVRKSFEEYAEEFMQRCISDAETWRRPNRRFESVYLPSRSAPAMQKLVVGVDTSGSITSADLARFVQATERIAQDFGVKELILMHCDTKVRRVDRFVPGQVLDVVPEGGGGTRFSPVFEHTQELIDAGEEIAGVVYLTDLEGDCGGWQRFTDIETLWVCSKPEKEFENLIFGLPKFGRVCSLHS